MKSNACCGLGVCILLLIAWIVPCQAETGAPPPPSEGLRLANSSGITVQVATKYSDPALWLSIPGEASGSNAVLLLLPEHVTVRRHGTIDGEHLYLWRPRKSDPRPNWVQVGNALEYEKDFPSHVHFLARVSLDADGLLLHYEFVNNADADFDSVQAVSDPRMISPLLHDVRLERTYVHERGNFVLLASDMPQRITMPLNEWLPNRYRISYSLPVRKELMEKQPDGITFINAQSRADAPVIATVSTDGKWIMATFSRNPGNVWTNPELTCQHADEEITLARGHKGVTEEKILLVRGNLNDVLARVKEQRGTLE